MSSSPLIAVTASRSHLPHEAHLYMQAIERAGGLAEFVYPGTGKIDLADHFDGFLFPGGKDIDPSLYNEDVTCAISSEDNKRTAFELFLLHGAIRRNKPVLGICYGMQLINLFFKGNLYQDIQTQKEGALDHRKGRHGVSVQTNPFLQSGHFEVNSSHHQALKNVGRGLVPFAYAEDGIIEGIYHDSYVFLFGIQWHPERMQDELSRKVFSSFIGECHEP